MSSYEITAIVISIVALVTTGINIILYVVLTNKYHSLVEEQNEISKEQNKISQGQAETQMRELIMNAKWELNESSEKLVKAKINTENNTLCNVYQQLFDVAQEDLRNAYEEACSRYLDEKIDKERFKRMYLVEIRNLVENKDQEEYFHPSKSRYKCILKVYDEWNNLEK